LRFAGPERRRMPRYYVTVPVEFDGGTGTTKDVNESGVRFEIDQPLVPDQSVTLRLVFRDFQGGDPWRMAARGKVVRSRPTGRPTRWRCESRPTCWRRRRPRTEP